MKLVRLRGDRRFYSILLNDLLDQECFDFSMVVPQSLRLVTPLDANEYLPVLAAMLNRAGGLSAQVERLRRAGPDDFRAFRHPFDRSQLAAPVQPASLRLYESSPEHARVLRQRAGLDLPAEWHESPVGSFLGGVGCVGAEATVRRPPETSELDYEPGIAAVIGREGQDVPVAEADSHIIGFTLLNAWCLRDVQRREMRMALGPLKSRDFATSIGPCLVTADELEARVLPDLSRGRRYDLPLTAHVNGLETSRGNLRDMHWTFAELVAHASRNTLLLPGDLIGAGGIGATCLSTLPREPQPQNPKSKIQNPKSEPLSWLQPGDVVRLEAEVLGILENRIA